MSEHTWALRIHARAPTHAAVYVRRHRYEVGPSVSFDPEADRPSALEHVLGGIGADVVSAFFGALRRRRLSVDEVEATVDGALENALVALGVVGETGTPRLQRVDLEVYVNSLEPEAHLLAAWAEALERSPMAATLMPIGVLFPQLKVVA